MALGPHPMASRVGRGHARRDGLLYAPSCSFFALDRSSTSTSSGPPRATSNPLSVRRRRTRSLVALAVAAEPSSPWAPPAVASCSKVGLLVKYDYSYIAANKCDLCGSVSQDFCEYDWPSNDVPACADFDTMRNGIYAYYGRAFETQKWKDYFSKQTWYKVNPAYSDTLLSAEAKRNVALLKDMAEKGTACAK